MDPKLKDAHMHMLQLGLGALQHANWHSSCYSMENPFWAELSVLQAAHAAEILIKARIAQEHHLLIFEKLPKVASTEPFLTTKQLMEEGQTFQYKDLPQRLWAATGIVIPNKGLYEAFGRLRNMIQHYSPPDELTPYPDDFIYGVIDPFINHCWGLFAIDYNDDSAPYEYLVATLIARGTKFLVSPALAENLDYIELQWPSNSPEYRREMETRFKIAKEELDTSKNE